MEFKTAAAPHSKPVNTVGRVMREVLYALIPATLVYVWYFGIGLLANILIATVVALGFEAMLLAARDKSLERYLLDGSAVVTAVLLAFCLPPLTPWWITAVGSAFAIVFAKHLYGGLGYNPFNPAMAGYVVLLICFPVELTQWLRPEMLVEDSLRLGVLDQLGAILTGNLPASVNVDAVTSATPLDLVKTALAQNQTIPEVRASILFGDFGGKGWEWIANWIAIGGLWLLWRGVIRWQIPVALLGTLGVLAAFFYLLDPGSHGSPGFHIFSGGAMLGAFFIATDPVTGPASNRGRLIYGACIGLFTFIIRTWGGYPDGIAFAVLLMNAAVPLIDRYTKPRAYGHRPTEKRQH